MADELRLEPGWLARQFARTHDELAMWSSSHRRMAPEIDWSEFPPPPDVRIPALEAENTRLRAALAVVLPQLRVFVQDQEHEIISAQSMRFVAQDILAECQRLLGDEARQALAAESNPERSPQ